MEEKKVTPEERLLKIIETPDQQVMRRKSAAKTGDAGTRSMTPGDFLKGLPVFLSASSWKTFKAPGFRVINKSLLICAIFMTLFVLFDFFRFSGIMNRKFDKICSAGTAGERIEDVHAVPVFDPASALALARKNNIFSLLPVSSTAASDMPEDVSRIINNLKLVGIIWSHNPQAMVESTKEQKTILVSTGDVIGIMTVKKILRDRVIIGKDDKEWELR